MRLSNTSIEDAMKRGSLVITPCPSSKHMSVTSVDMRLGHTIYIIKDRSKPLFFDPRRQTIQAFWDKNGEAVDLRQKRTQPFSDDDGVVRRRVGYWLAPGDICLGFTHERIELPIDGEQVLQGSIWSRSRTARGYLKMHTDAPHVKPNTNNQITLEIKNDGVFWVRLCYLDALASMDFEEVQGKVRPAPSAFHGQKKPSGS